MQQELSIIQLILNASFVVQLVIGILLFFSIVSWGIIINKWLSITHANISTNSFLRQFANATNISTLYTTISAQSNKHTVTEIFYQGINEYNKLHKQNIKNPEIILENIERTMTSTINSEIDKYEHRISSLATFGSVSPYIGLLGTVWGIMHAFIGLSNQGQATLSSVAPGIAEALVATAIGLFVAIPAYIFYNKFTTQIDQLNNKMNHFGNDFLNMINRKIANNTNINNDNEGM